MLTTLFVVSCSDTIEPPVDMEEEELAADPIDVITRLTLDQKLEGPNTFQLLITNEEPIDCLEEIKTNWTGGTDSKLLEIDYVNNPGCSEGMEYLTYAFIPQLDVTETNIDVSIEGIVNNGKLSQGDNRFQLKLQTTDKLIIDRLYIDKIPENIAWGYANLTSDQCRDIRVSYNQLQGIPEDLIMATDFPEGNHYGYFEIGDLNSVIGMEGQENSGQSMILDLTKDNSWQVLTDMLRGMKQSCPTLEYYFQNAEGEITQS